MIETVYERVLTSCHSTDDTIKEAPALWVKLASRLESEWLRAWSLLSEVDPVIGYGWVTALSHTTL